MHICYCRMSFRYMSYYILFRGIHFILSYSAPEKECICRWKFTKNKKTEKVDANNNDKKTSNCFMKLNYNKLMFPIVVHLRYTQRIL